MSQLSRVAAVAGRIMVMAALAGAVLVLVAIGVGPRTGAYQLRTVLTGSMRPGLPPGSVVAFRPVELSKLRVGDVIAYRIPVEDRRIVTHRIVEIKESGDYPVLVTKGDANRDPDPWAVHLRGRRAWKAAASVPKVGLALQTFREPAFRMASLVLAPSLFAGVSLVQIWRRPEDGVPDEPLAPVAPARIDELVPAAEPLRFVAPTEPEPPGPGVLARWRERHLEARRVRSFSKELDVRAGRPLSEQERWQQWRERRVLQHQTRRPGDD